MKLKRCIASALTVATLATVCVTSALAAGSDYTYNFDSTLTRPDIVETDQKIFTSGGRGTAESTGILGGKEVSDITLYTGVVGDSWTVYVDDSITWALKDNTLVISGDGTAAKCSTDTSPFYDNPYIKTVIVEEDVKQLSPSVFTGMPNLETIFVMNANTMIDKSILEAPNLKAVIYGAGLNDELYVNHYLLSGGAIVSDDLEVIVLSKNIASFAALMDFLTIRSDSNLSVYNKNGVHLPIAVNGVIQQGVSEVSQYARNAVKSFTSYENKMSYEDILARARSYTTDLPQTAKNLLPAELTTGSVNPKPEKTFVTSSWATESVKTAQNLGIVPDTLPDNLTGTITRGDFCEIIAPLYEKLSGQEITERVYFSDTGNEAVEKLAGIGVVGGVGGDTFAPNNSLTRAEAAAIFARIGNRLGVPADGATTAFADCNNHWASEAIQTCCAMGLMQGTSATTFAPASTLTAEQAIAIAVKVWDKMM